jgi:hypothetical protein
MCGVEFLKFDLQSMKTMKYILLIICVACASTMMAVDYKVHQTSSFKSTSSIQFYSGSGVGVTLASTTVASVPAAEFRSTSAMPSVGSTLSATTPAMADDAGMSITPGPKRARPEDWEDPFPDPLGDAVLPLLLLAAGYAIYLRRKNSVRTSDSGHQQ